MIQSLSLNPNESSISSGDDMNLGLVTLNNKDGATLSSQKNLNIIATTVNNQSATIAAKDNLNVTATTINNIDTYFSSASTQSIQYPRYRYTGDVNDNWQYHTIVTETFSSIANSLPARMQAGGDITFTGTTLNNTNGRITAQGDITGNVTALNNSTTFGEHRVSESGTADHTVPSDVRHLFPSAQNRIFKKISSLFSLKITFPKK